MSINNYFQCEFSALSENEALARSVVSAFAIPLDPTLDELSDLRTAVSEAVTNAIIHGYKDYEGEIPPVKMSCLLTDANEIVVCVEDFGCGIKDIQQARQPMYTSLPELERSGLGFTIMESFTDKLEVVSEAGKGTKITMTKSFGAASEG